MRTVIALALVLLSVTVPTSAAEQAHMVFFQLADPSAENSERLAGLCHKHLAKIPGITYFSVGVRSKDLARDVNDKDFEVALHVVFKDRAAHDVYATHPDHLRFIEAGKPLWTTVRVFDSNLTASPSVQAAPLEKAAATGE